MKTCYLTVMGHPIRVIDTHSQRRIFEVVPAADATQFDSPNDAVRKARWLNLREYRIQSSASPRLRGKTVPSTKSHQSPMSH